MVANSARCVPALERLRDVAAAGGIDRRSVHTPDRLACRYAYQVLLIDELTRAGVEVIFLNHALGRTPEDEVLLQVQGMVAEYERAKILERARRDKLHAARAGAVNVLGHAPYGYRYVRKADGGGQARDEVVLEEARRAPGLRMGRARAPEHGRGGPAAAGGRRPDQDRQAPLVLRSRV